MVTKEFLTSYELGSALMGLNPSVEKEIKNIEQSTYAATFITNTPRNLKILHKTSSLDENAVKLLIQRNVLTTYDFLEFENGKIEKRVALIRPVSLKYEDVDKVIRVCNEYSLISFLKFLIHEEQVFYSETERYRENFQRIFDNVLYFNKNVGQELIYKFEFFDVKSLLQRLISNNNLQSYLLQHLTRTGRDIYDYLRTNKEMDEEVGNFLLMRSNSPVIMNLAEGFYLFYPTLPYTIIKEDRYKLRKTYWELLFELGLNIVRKILAYALEKPDVENLDFRELVNLYSQSPELQSGLDWQKLRRLLEILIKMHGHIENFRTYQKDFLIKVFVSGIEQDLITKYEPYVLSAKSISIPYELEEVFQELKISQQYLFVECIKLLEKNNEILVFQTKENESYYLLYRANVAKAFIQNREKRNFIHNLLRQTHFPNGIYDFVISEAPDYLKEEQEKLKKAIKEWEKEREDKNKKGFWRILLDFLMHILSLFLLPSSNSPQERSSRTNNKPSGEVLDTSDSARSPAGSGNSNVTNKKKVKLKKPYIPKEKLKVIPEKIEKAISYIERQYDGLIWVDELAFALNFNDDIEKLSSILYFDKYQRFEEIKPLNKIKPLYIRRENLLNENWVEKTITYLKQSSKLPHQMALLGYLEKFRDSMD